MTSERLAGGAAMRTFVAPIVALALAAAVAVLLAYQLPITHRIDVAADPDVLTGFYGREQNPQFAFRWTRDESAITLPSLPSGAHRFDLGVAAPRPATAPPAEVEIALDDTVVRRIALGAAYQRLTFDVTLPPTRDGVHTLQLRTSVFAEATRNPRTLGIVVTDIAITPVRWLLVPPPLPVVAFVGETAMLHCFLLLHRRRRFALAAAGGVALLVTLSVFPFRRSFATLVDRSFLPCAFLCGIAVAGHYLAFRATRPIRMLAAVALLLSGVFSAARYFAVLGARGTTDFGIFYRAAIVVWTHHTQDLYDLPGIAADPLLGVVYRQPPLPAVLTAPLALFSFDAALSVWRALLIGCVAAAIALLARELGLHAIGAPRGWPLVALVALTLLWLPLRDSIVGQWDAILLLLLVLAFIGLRRDMPPLVGAAIALAGIIKLYPLYLALFLLWKRDWRALGWLAASLAVLMAVGAFVVGWGTTVLYVRQVLPQIGGSTSYTENQSLLALFMRIFRVAGPHGPRVALLTAVSLSLVTLPLCWRLRGRASRTSSRYAIDFSLTISAMLLAIPAAWQHYEVLLLLPVGVLLATLATSSPPAPGWLVWTTSAVAFLTLGQEMILRGMFRLPLGRHSFIGAAIVVSAPVFAQIGFAVALCARSLCPPPADAARPNGRCIRGDGATRAGSAPLGNQ